ncbi:endonuclease iii, putative [Perkinsus marinus ATCC 50983]|uniref:Endonuclease iii, putative n=1 Tax=Perkinsus marinus (strain ATCC 50983 / TXsc) TaxID=423536 RepID=C5KFQ9_PERM5|nr:endonuclease iii, putative [Perkinsus marinus ATCC 50983]EER16683.1 endonuclease iii, putative [Perkinsus marinus ATCC 50983]|eukprot:XP_002784887.1 endonuclease iii, putative [Perkinsus marinus ATCC 50983]
MEDLLSLPGVGPKMAVLVMEIGHGHRDAGICVDTHVHRIAAMLGWTKNAKTPEATRQQLEARLPLKVWPDVNLLLVGLGQMVQQRPFELLRRCIDCIHPLAALKLVGRIGCNLKVVDKLTGDTIVDVAEAAHCGQDVMDYLKTRGVEEGHRSPARITPSRRKRKGDAGTAEEARRGSAKCRAGLDGFTYSGH